LVLPQQRDRHFRPSHDVSCRRAEEQFRDRPVFFGTDHDLFATQPPGEGQDHLTRIPDADVRVRLQAGRLDQTQRFCQRLHSFFTVSGLR
jgi:hypothetical protein